MKKQLLFLFMLSFMGALSLMAQKFQSFKIDDQTGTFTVRFTAVPSVANLDAVVGLAGKQIAGFNELNCILRFGTDNKIDVRNGAAYAAAADLSYVPGKRYYVQMDVNVANATYSVKVTPQGSANAIVLATDYAFRADFPSATISHFATAIGGQDKSASIGVIDFQMGIEDIIANHDNFNTQLPTQTGDFFVKFVATPSGDNLDAAVGLSSMKVDAWPKFNCLIQFGTGGLIKVRNGATVEALKEVSYKGGSRYMFFVTGSTVTKTYSVVVVSPAGKIDTLAIDYGFRLNDATGDEISYLVQRAVHAAVPGSYIAVDGIETGSFGMDGVNPAVIQSFATESGIFSKEFVAIPSMDSINVGIAFNETNSKLWPDMSAIIYFASDGTLKVRNGAANAADSVVKYNRLGAYYFKVDMDVTTDKYSVSVRTTPHENPIVLATDYSFRKVATSIGYMTNKSTWDPAFGKKGGYVTLSNVGIPVKLDEGPQINKQPFISAIENVTMFVVDAKKTVDLFGITDGDGGVQVLTATLENQNPSVATVELKNFTSGVSTAQLDITPLAVGVSTITLTLKDDGGTENGGIDELVKTFVVEIKEWSSIRDYTIKVSDGEWGADNRIISGNDCPTCWEDWIATNTGGARIHQDNNIVNNPARFCMAYYLRFDLNQLKPSVGGTTNAKFQIYTTPKAKDRDSIILFALEDYYFPIKDFQGKDDIELDEFYIEGNMGSWFKVYDADGAYVPGYEDWITADNAPGFNEGNKIDISVDWNYFNEDVLHRIGGIYKVPAGDSILTIDHADVSKYLTEDENGVVVFVLARFPQPGVPWNPLNVYSGEDHGMEPRVIFTWNDNGVELGKVNEIQKAKIYPNPAQNILYYSQALNIKTISVKNIMGRTVLSAPVKSADGYLDISGIESGAYLVEFYNQNNQKAYTNKVIIK